MIYTLKINLKTIYKNNHTRINNKYINNTVSYNNLRYI